MPIANPAQASQFNTAYDRIGKYVQDDTLVPYYNPADSEELVLPGEPMLLAWGEDGEYRVYLAQGPIRPGEVGMLKKGFTADFPCDVSANVILGQEVMWDADNMVVSLAADVTNGFILGDASYALDPNIKNKAPTLDGDDNVIVATTASTVIRVISRDAAATTKGNVVPSA